MSAAFGRSSAIVILHAGLECRASRHRPARRAERSLFPRACGFGGECLSELLVGASFGFVGGRKGRAPGIQRLDAAARVRGHPLARRVRCGAISGF